MLLTRENLITRLREHLGGCRQIDVAVAWAADCDALEALCDFAASNSLRAIIGIWGNATHPNALRRVQRCGQLRIATGVEGLFHPKFYLFHRSNGRIGWIGSANLTHGGFGQNEELVYEFSDENGTAAEWFDQCWNSLGDDEDSKNALDEYERRWKPPAPPPRSPQPHEREVAEGEIYEMAGGLGDWDSYAAAIVEADEYWAVQWDREAPVTGETESWLSTIMLGQAVVRRPDWSDLSREDFHLLLGRARYGLLGSMGGAGRANNVFNEATPANVKIRRTIRAALQPVIDATDANFAEAACAFITALNSIDGFGGAIATRLLALARPDRAISVNNGSRTRLAELTGLPENSLAHAPHGRARSYMDLLRWFEQRDWYTNPTPRNARERLLAGARAAIFDCFVYDPDE
jgi:HKD family nuclease